MKKDNRIFALPVLFLIRLYQRTISKDHGPANVLYPWGYCRFYPTCSEYAYQVIEKYGLFFGGFKAIKRLLRCNPFSRGGFEPIPPVAANTPQTVLQFGKVSRGRTKVL